MKSVPLFLIIATVPLVLLPLTSFANNKIVVDPRAHAFYAYNADGKLVYKGAASAGMSWCSDIHRPCRTKVGTFTIKSIGGRGCYSTKFPLGRGGSPMPYCMYFNGGQAIHGSYHVSAVKNLSHGCVRISVADATWLRFNFAKIGTTVIIKPY